MMKNKYFFIILFLLVFLFLAGCSSGGITTTPTDPIHNLTKGAYYATIRDALDDADNDNTIEVSDGTYDESIYFPPGKKILLRSVNGPSSTIIRGVNNEYTVNLENSLDVTTIEGFSITHALFQYGGGMYNDLASSLIINHCIISGNTSDYGGGIHNRGIMTLKGVSTVFDNFASYGGGIYMVPGGNPGTPVIGGSSAELKNTICGNFLSGHSPALDQQIRDSSGDLYNICKLNNNISAYCIF